MLPSAMLRVMAYPTLLLALAPVAAHTSRSSTAYRANLVKSFFAYAPSSTGGVFVACGDVNGDGQADIITGAGAGGGPHVEVFDGATGAVLDSFVAYGATFTGGVAVAAGAVAGDGKADVITGPGPGGEPHVQVVDGKTGNVLQDFVALDPGFLGGVSVG